MICSSCPLDDSVSFYTLQSSLSASQTPRCPPQPARGSLAGASRAEFIVLSAALLPWCVLPFLLGHEGLHLHADPGQAEAYERRDSLTLLGIRVLLLGIE